MATRLSGVANFLKEAKEVLAVVGVLGEIVAFFAKLPGVYAILIGIFSSLFILMWGWFERKNAFILFKILAVIGIPAGAAGFLFFTAVGITLIVSEPPTSSFGRVVDDGVWEFSLNTKQADKRLTGHYVLELNRKADLAEIGVMPASDDLGKVEKIDISTQGPLNHTNKMVELLNKRSDTQIHYRVSDPPQDFKVTLVTTADLKAADSTSGINMRVYYKYGERDRLSEAISWVFESFGQ